MLLAMKIGRAFRSVGCHSIMVSHSQVVGCPGILSLWALSEVVCTVQLHKHNSDHQKQASCVRLLRLSI